MTSSKRDFTISSGGLYVGIFASEQGQQLLLYLEDVAATCFRTLKEAATNLFDNASRSLPLIFAQVANWDAAIRHEEAQKAIALYKDIEVIYKAVLMDYANQITSAAPIAESLGKSTDKRRIRLKIPGFTEFLFEFMRTLSCSEMVQSLRYFDSTHFVERKLSIMDAIRKAMAKCLQGRIEFSITTSSSKTDHNNSSSSASITTPYPNIMHFHHQNTHDYNTNNNGATPTGMLPSAWMNSSSNIGGTNGSIHPMSQHHPHLTNNYVSHQQQPGTLLPPSIEFPDYQPQEACLTSSAQSYIPDNTLPIGRLHTDSNRQQNRHRNNNNNISSTNSNDISTRDESIIPSGTSSQSNSSGSASRHYQPIFHAHRPSNMAESASAFAQSFVRQQQNMQKQPAPTTIESTDPTGSAIRPDRNNRQSPAQQQQSTPSTSTATTVGLTPVNKSPIPPQTSQNQKQPQQYAGTTTTTSSTSPSTTTSSVTTALKIATSLPNTPLITATKLNPPTTTSTIISKISGSISNSRSNTDSATTTILSDANHKTASTPNTPFNDRSVVNPVQDTNKAFPNTSVLSVPPVSNESQIIDNVTAAAATPLISASSASSTAPPPTPKSSVQRESFSQPRPAPVGVASNNDLSFSNPASSGSNTRNKPPQQHPQRFPPKFIPGSIGPHSTEEPEFRVITVKKPPSTTSLAQQQPFMVPIPPAHGNLYDADSRGTNNQKTVNNRGKQKKKTKRTQASSAKGPMFMMMPYQQQQHPYFSAAGSTSFPFGDNDTAEFVDNDDDMYYESRLNGDDDDDE